MILKNIRTLRIKRCETIIDMAEKFNMPIWRLSAIENGRIDMPDDFLKNLFEISLMPLIIFILIMGAYLVLFFIDELKYQNEIRNMKRR